MYDTITLTNKSLPLKVKYIVFLRMIRWWVKLPFYAISDSKYTNTIWIKT